jgi:hypothetical protein
MSITTEEAEQMAEICDQLGGFAQCAAAIRSLAAERDALRAENAVMLAALRRINSSITPPQEIMLQAENEKLRAALRGVLTYYNAPTPAEAKLKKAVLATPIEQACAALGEKQ